MWNGAENKKLKERKGNTEKRCRAEQKEQGGWTLMRVSARVVQHDIKEKYHEGCDLGGYGGEGGSPGAESLFNFSDDPFLPFQVYNLSVAL